ncbi:hypothetical protein ACFQ3Z_16135 [Streptomyces nogalater]
MEARHRERPAGRHRKAPADKGTQRPRAKTMVGMPALTGDFTYTV